MALSGRPLTRRLVLGTAAASAITALGVAPATAAGRSPAADDEFDTLRTRWRNLLTGTGFDATAQPYRNALAALGTQAGGFAKAMTATLWADLPLGKVSNNITQSYKRLATMALAYAQPGTGFTGDAALGAQVTAGLDQLATTAYTPNTATYDNWWDWQIGAPQAMLDACVLVFPLLSDAQLGRYNAAVDHFVPDSAVAVYTGTSTGANRADLCRVIALRGVLGRSSAKIATASSALSPIFPYVTTGDGLYADGSFIQHTWVPYTNSYGEVMLGDFSRLFTLLAGSTWAVTDPQRGTVLDAVQHAFAPFIVNGLAMDGLSGRAISRGLQGASPTPQSDHTRGHLLISDILRLAESGVGTAGQTAAWRAMVKGWLQREKFQPCLEDPGVGVPELARAQALLADGTVAGTPEPVGHRVFGMDRSVHRRPQWTAAISMCSARTTYYENGNGENLRGWHTNAGMLYWWGSDDQYSDAFWPTVDPYRLPGTTVSTRKLADGYGGAWGAPKPAATFAGGATDGVFAAVGQDVRGLGSTLVAKKSWFCLDDIVVCLGAGITATDGVPVETIVDNRRVSTEALVVDGQKQPRTDGWSRQLRRARIATVDDTASYLFPGGATVNAARISRTGAWHDINTSSSTQPITRDYLTLWFDHGVDPVNATYSYVLMPGGGRPQLRLLPRIIANTATVQAIEDPATNTIAATFFAAGTASPLHVDAPCSVLIRRQGRTLTVAVSDPTQTASSITVTYEGRTLVKADVAGARGASQVQTIRKW
ncbi:polysaccharide lyase 8 family protein [Kutzneria sp. CA-103260]|uniref:polysaccharide lyase 8 family protein n=1 Tax=Kutzneria sp. CA-103260 TaxID=2802641 RepID=UPI001BA8D3C1|nr:polysaccharide lyase 8 family protein [Kutzneria sp. CA-103260]QUQ65599.1 lyase [Kutzneria sp. CA-103260]